MITTPKEGIPVRNAGLVITNSYMPALFERSGLMQNQTFLNEAAQEEAVYLLQCVATGATNTPALQLSLNNILCGLPLAHPLPEDVSLPADQQTMIHGMITAMIGHWPETGSSSVAGFRGNWLVRDGLLTEHEDYWELIVEKRAYDLLLQRAPFSFSVIRHAWMPKPLQVTWPY